MPVYNGARYVSCALDSLLCQTYHDFELIICDNASSDGTEEICRSYAAADARVRYYRNERNLGAAANFNLAFELASGEYFTWAAHDDIHAPGFLERCLEMLEASPDAVLAQSLVGIIDERGELRGVYDPRVCGTDRSRPAQRLAGRLGTTMCVEVFGLIRADTLRDGRLIANHIGADWTLLVDLALSGRFVVVPEILFYNRDHADRGSRPRMNLRERHAWYAGRSKPLVSHSRVLLTSCLDSIRRRVEGRAERVRCYGHLVSWLVLRGRLLRLVLEPVVGAHPRLYDAAVKLRAVVFRSIGRHARLD